MGKVLIIKGADFSSVAVGSIPTPGPNLVNELNNAIVFQKEGSWVSSGSAVPTYSPTRPSHPNSMCVSSLIDVTSIFAGKNSIKFTPKDADVQLIIYLGDGHNNAPETTWKYYTGENTFSLSGITKMMIALEYKNPSSVMDTSKKLLDFMKVTIS